jgi:hypothetical protein
MLPLIWHNKTQDLAGETQATPSIFDNYAGTDKLNRIRPGNQEIANTGSTLL